MYFFVFTVFSFLLLWDRLPIFLKCRNAAGTEMDDMDKEATDINAVYQ